MLFLPCCRITRLFDRKTANITRHPFGHPPEINVRRKIPAGERDSNNLLKCLSFLYCISFRPTDKSDEHVHTGFLKKAPRSEQICRPENPPTPHGNPPPGSPMAPSINGVSPSLQNDGIIRHPAIAFAHEGKTAGGFADPAFTKEQNAETPNPDEHAVNHDLPLAPLPKQAGQTAVEQ
jgi:hypothetical protein